MLNFQRNFLSPPKCQYLQRFKDVTRISQGYKCDILRNVSTKVVGRGRHRRDDDDSSSSEEDDSDDDDDSDEEDFNRRDYDSADFSYTCTFLAFLPEECMPLNFVNHGSVVFPNL